MWVLVILARPFVRWKVALVALLVAAYGVIYAVPFLREFYAVPVTDRLGPWLVAASAAVVGIVLIELVTRRTDHRRQNRERDFELIDAPLE